MIRIATVIGARPQIIKASALSREIHNSFSNKIEEIIIHTGQHYDDNMSEVFFREMQVPKPKYNLNVGSASHGVQTARMIEGLETIFVNERPDFVVLYGDTNSTLAGAIAASKIHIPVAHIEAGLRSFNKSMPEEINRILCDHVATLLFSPTATGFHNLISEGFKPDPLPPYSNDNPKIYHCGDVMYDNSRYFQKIAEKHSNTLKQYELLENEFVLVTIHRDNNTDIPERLNALFASIIQLSEETGLKFILPLHPRTSKLLSQNLYPDIYLQLNQCSNIIIIPPATFFDMIVLESHCKMVMTDSGGVQKEAFFFRKPVIIMRPETEWVEIVDCGAGKIVDANETRIKEAFHHYLQVRNIDFPALFGDGHAAHFICNEILNTAR